MAQPLRAVPHEAHGRPAMSLHLDRNLRLEPHAHPEAADPGQDDQPEQTFQPVRAGDAGPLHIEPADLEARERALHRPASPVQHAGVPHAEIRGNGHQVPRRGPGGHDLHHLTVDVGPLGEAPHLPDLQISKPRVHAQLVHDGVLPDADGPFDALAPQEAEPLPTDELPVSDEALPAGRWKGLQES